MVRTALALVVLMLGACTTSAPAESATAPVAAPADAAPPGTTPTPAPAPMPAACNAEAARGAIGQTASAEVVEQARLAAGAAIARTLKPGQMVTMEYHGGRLNLDVDADNVVTGVRCG